MTGPEHYSKAETLLAYGFRTEGGATIPPAPDIIALAQVHATLALVAATVDTYHDAGIPANWTPVIS